MSMSRNYDTILNKKSPEKSTCFRASSKLFLIFCFFFRVFSVYISYKTLKCAIDIKKKSSYRIVWFDKSLRQNFIFDFLLLLETLMMFTLVVDKVEIQMFDGEVVKFFHTLVECFNDLVDKLLFVRKNFYKIFIKFSFYDRQNYN